MPFFQPVALLPAAFSMLVTAQSCPGTTLPDLSWHQPASTNINNLTEVLNGTGIYGFIFNSSILPASTPYGTFNWCNMPHVRPQEYMKVNSSYKLEYVEIIHRHHKRTPYASNTFPVESHPWNCDDEALFYYGVPYPAGTSAQVNWHVYTSPNNPFSQPGFRGSCQFPQITGQGLEDSLQHGKDLYAVYHDLLDFLPSTLDPTKIVYRVTNNIITSQVASQLIQGQYSDKTNTAAQVRIQPPTVDSLEPTYPCSAASTNYSLYAVSSTNPNWTAHLTAPETISLYNTLDTISGIETTSPAWHHSLDHYFDNLSSRQCHSKPLPCQLTNSNNCITQSIAEFVYRLGQYEYSYIYRDSPFSLAAAVGSYGVWVAELASNIRATIDHTSPIIYQHNIAHDGSIAHLLSILQIDQMVWPGMGAEVVFETYSSKNCYFVRVLWGGQVLQSSNPSLGRMDMVPMNTFLGYIDGLVGVSANKIPALCSGDL